MAKPMKEARRVYGDPNRTVLADVLTERRASLREVAAASGVSRAMIGHVSNGLNGIAADKARAIAAALDTPVDHLFVDVVDHGEES